MNTISRNNFVRSVFVFLLGWSFFLLSLESRAASFDCRKASTQVENLICADSALSGLDDDLERAYRSAKIGNSDVPVNQRDWLLNVRNQCTTNVCLEVAYKSRLNTLKGMTLCPVKEIDILGSWMREKNGFFEEMMISYDHKTRNFNSWLHHHPEMSGNWEYVDCTIKIFGPEKLNFEFKAKKLKNNKLYLLDDETNEISIYKKIK